MDQEVQHKNILFLYAISQELIERATKEGFSVTNYISKIRNKENVEVRELSREALALVDEYNYVVILAHHDFAKDALLLPNGSFLPLNVLVSSLPKQLEHEVTLDFAVCRTHDDKKQTNITDLIKEISPGYFVLSAEEKTDIKTRLAVYRLLFDVLQAHPEANYLDAFRFCLNKIKFGIQRRRQEENENSRQLIPSTTKLGGTESSEEIKTSVFIPKEVTRDEYFKLQIYMHWDEDTGTLYLNDARGNDPNTAQRKRNVAIKGIHKGDKLFLNLCFLDAKDRDPIPSEQIKIKEELNIIGIHYNVGITIKDEYQTFVVHIKIVNEYPYRKFFSVIQFLKDGKPLIPEFDLESEVKAEVPANIHNIERRREISSIQNKLTREPERIDLTMEQMKQYRTENRQEILVQVLDLVNRGDWRNYEVTADKVKQMLQTVLGEGEIKLNDNEYDLSEKLWSLLEEGRGDDRVRIVWQNLVGYFDEKKLFREKGSPALNKDFFGDDIGYANIDKGRPKRDVNGEPVFDQTKMSKGFYQIIELLDKYYMEIIRA